MPWKPGSNDWLQLRPVVAFLPLLGLLNEDDWQKWMLKGTENAIFLILAWFTTGFIMFLLVIHEVRVSSLPRVWIKPDQFILSRS